MTHSGKTTILWGAVEVLGCQSRDLRFQEVFNGRVLKEGEDGLRNGVLRQYYDDMVNYGKRISIS
jgi:hypothetical protein